MAIWAFNKLSFDVFLFVLGLTNWTQFGNESESNQIETMQVGHLKPLKVFLFSVLELLTSYYWTPYVFKLQVNVLSYHDLLGNFPDPKERFFWKSGQRYDWWRKCGSLCRISFPKFPCQAILMCHSISARWYKGTRSVITKTVMYF